MDRDDMKALYDVIIVGGGPAGLTAALYLARARYRTLVIEKEKLGGQITITSEVVNYPGVERVSGTELTETMRKQAEHFGAEFLMAEVTGIEHTGAIKSVRTERGTLKCFGILIAAGARPRMIGFEGESEFRGRGVAYCATCDGEFFSGKDVFVIGGGFAAAEESVFLTKYARHVTILVREPDFTCAEGTAEKARSNENITVLTNTVVDCVSGDTALRSMKYHNTVTGEELEYTAPEGSTFGVFVFAGYEPATELLKGIAKLDKGGYIITDPNCCAGAEGIYAAGDVCRKSLRQVVTAVGDGALAATELERYASRMQKETGMTPVKPVQKSDIHKESGEEGNGVFLTGDMKAQLEPVFARMENGLILKLSLDASPPSEELKRYMDELAALTDKIKIETGGTADERPCVQVFRENGEYSGLAFHGVPGGHEFTSFVLGLYNAAGPGQPVDEEAKTAISDINETKNIKILVSLSCTMCPELVTSAQRIASLSGNVTAEVYDINRFPELKDKYNVMSVPCLIINGKDVHFGKKNIKQLLELL